MTKAVIQYDDGTNHKLSFPDYDYDNMARVVASNIQGYPNLKVSHISIWVER